MTTQQRLGEGCRVSLHHLCRNVLEYRSYTSAYKAVTHWGGSCACPCHAAPRPETPLPTWDEAAKEWRTFSVRWQGGAWEVKE